MANDDRPRGAQISGELIRVNEYTAGADVYPGDFVAKQADGKVDPVATGGSSYSSSTLGVAMHKAADGEKIAVADHPDQLYVIQADGSDVDAQTDIGLNYAILGTDPDTTYDLSRQELDSDTGATTSTLPLKLLRIDTRDDNALGAQVDCVVQINAHQSGNATAGV